MELKSPKTPHPRDLSTCQHPPTQKSGNLDTSNPNLTQPCGWGGGPGSRRPSNPWAVTPNSPQHPAPTCRVDLWPPVSMAFPPTLRWESLKVQWGARNNLWCECLWSHSAMEAMNQSGQPRNSGRRGQCGRLPWQVEVHLWRKSLVGSGRHTRLQYPFLIKLASLSGKYEAVFFLVYFV